MDSARNGWCRGLIRKLCLVDWCMGREYNTLVVTERT
jgi:hypothetical protein